MWLIVLQLWLIVERTKLIMVVFATSGKSCAGTILPLESVLPPVAKALLGLFCH